MLGIGHRPQARCNKHGGKKNQDAESDSQTLANAMPLKKIHLITLDAVQKRTDA
ncbi:hypothetical protein [Xanthomonas sp. A1809]|uniref:hypothetical protein n=1 Tax=Xanthomonas sp. A1809 TaxID=2821275 RepID=UPI001FD40D42|nr:hypothetical protein [Xanthomonas sp. A1809]